MALKQKILIVWASLVSSKNALASSGGLTVAGMAVFGDWITWASAGAGAVAYGLTKPEARKPATIGNGIISVGSGGFGGSFAMQLVATRGYPEPSIYFCAFLMALAAPFLWATFTRRGSKAAQIIWDLLVKRGIK